MTPPTDPNAICQRAGCGNKMSEHILDRREGNLYCHKGCRETFLPPNDDQEAPPAIMPSPCVYRETDADRSELLPFDPMLPTPLTDELYRRFSAFGNNAHSIEWGKQLEQNVQSLRARLSDVTK